MSRIHAFFAKRPLLERLMLPVCATFCALMWGSAFPAIKYAYRFMDGSLLANRMAFAGIRFLIAGGVLLLFLSGKREAFRQAPKFRLFGIAIMQVVVQYTCFYWGLSMISGVIAAILVATGSFWWALLAPVFGQGEPLSARQWLFLVIGFAGVCVCVYRPDAHNESLFLGGLLILGTSLSATTASLMVKSLGGAVPTTFLTGFGLFTGGCILVLLSPGGVVHYFEHAGPQLIAITLHLALISAFAFSVWYLLITLFDITRLSGYRFLIPICGVLESALLIPGESLGLEILIGSLLVLSAVWLLERYRS